MNIAIIQMDIILGNPQENKKQVQKWVEKAMKENADVIVLPELWTTGYDLSRLQDIGDENGEDIQSFMRQLAQKHAVNIVAGSIAKKTQEGIYNTLYAFNRKGEVIGEYSKLHLITLMDEEKYLTPGEKKGNFFIEDIPAAGVICYDIRFPEWVRAPILDGAQMLFVPAEWPVQRLAHWRSLLIARAIENQCYIIAANCVGSDRNNTFAGHSLIIDPWGEIVAEAGPTEACVLSASIDPDLVTSVRKQIPIFDDRRPEHY
ncbi:Nitrilase/cyanide hydratase and apolipoprotein N-acyltransferase [Fictibacillus macauensis ZFHKF-1]|uniref:Nitrilase/cyanide hydratase and apolipoprotein N-acyltransferase n=1 Tax=Fictibacillus macauensis ZFHKF-1 TaxID=1196324 RepID=I8AGM9_9BACL|nr:carbon-nitrogen family hydrolase [Fictibacillus macauensis]EIT84549.1 Nitrilase/cyanide hydratase and apolipoprotein N-acyltransferase [Fictibacillus macauensis ZFHKF-1]